MWLRYAVLGLVASLALASAETSLETMVEQVMEEFHTIMPTGWAEAGIPVLEPAVIEKIPVNIKLTPFDAKCVASDIKVAGVSGYEVTKVQQLDGTSKVAISVLVPEVHADGQYDLDGKVKIGFINVKLAGKGPLEVVLQGLKGDVTADVTVNEDGSLTLADLKVDDWTYDNIKIQLDNLLDGGVLGKTVNKLINKLVPTFIKSNRAKINAMVETVAKKVINKYLDGIAGKVSQGHLLGEPEEDAFLELSLTHLEWTVSAETQALLAELALVAADTVRGADAELVPKVLSLLEDFRKMMPNGRPDLNIPVLDPATIDRMPVEIKLPPFDASAVSTDVHVAGVSAFKINKIEQVSGSNRLTVAIELPEVNVDGHYEIFGGVKIGFIDLNLSGGKGPLWVKMKGFKGTATVDMIVHDDGTLNMGAIRFDTWGFDRVEAHMDNVNMAKVVNALVNKLAPLFLELNRSWINKWGENVALIVTNRYLDGIAGRNVSKSAFELNKMAPGTSRVASSPFVLNVEAEQLLEQLALVLANRPKLAAALAA